MLDQIEALVALQEHGSTTLAAARLRLTQSALSKRLKSLQDLFEEELFSIEGRRLRLTLKGLEVVDKGRLLVAEARALTLPTAASPRELRLEAAVSDSILSSWGPSLLKHADRQIRGRLQLKLHAHRSVLAVEWVRAGRYALALCTDPLIGKDLVFEPLCEEPLVVVTNGFGPLRRGGTALEVNVIEEASASWTQIQTQFTKARVRGRPLKAGLRLESFASLIQMARHGYGAALVPLFVARALSVPTRAILPAGPELKRRICVVGRASILSHPTVADWIHALQAQMRRQKNDRGAKSGTDVLTQ